MRSTRPAIEIRDGGGAALVGHVHDLGAAHEFEQLAADMAGRTTPRRRVRKLAGIFLGVLDQFGDAVDRQRGRDRKQEVPCRDLRDGLEVALDIVGKLRDHVRPDRERTDTAKQQRVAVGLRLCDRVIADDESAAWPVLNDDRLAELL